MTSQDDRTFAVEQAVTFLSSGNNPSHQSEFLIKVATAIYAFINPVVSLKLIRGAISEQATGKVVPTPEGASPMATVLTDSQQVVFTVEADDAKGYPVVDASALSASVDNPSIATVQLNGTEVIVVSAAPGNAVLSVTDGTVTMTEAINVTAGKAATFKLTAGTPTEQAAATPTA